jgi:hypothetical protein
MLGIAEALQLVYPRCWGSPFASVEGYRFLPGRSARLPLISSRAPSFAADFRQFPRFSGVKTV